ncbi:MAG: signal peptidase I [Oscillospiraceae bacterium]|nr:signal peptidase I [Oscillospiraceae bacterium]
MKHQHLRTIYNTVYIIVSTTVITVGVLLVLQTLCGIRMYHVLTGSMGSLLPVGSACFVSTYSRYEDVRVGDVIAYRLSDEMLVTHRAVAVTDEGIITQGDMNNTPDETPVTAELYIGKTVFALPHLGALLESLHTVKGLVCIILGLTALWLGGLLYRSETEDPGRRSGQ